MIGVTHTTEFKLQFFSNHVWVLLSNLNELRDDKVAEKEAYSRLFKFNLFQLIIFVVWRFFFRILCRAKVIQHFTWTIKLKLNVSV